MSQQDHQQAGEDPREDREVRLLINAGRLAEANALLDRILSTAQDDKDSRGRPAVLTDRAVMAWRLR